MTHFQLSGARKGDVIAALDLRQIIFPFRSVSKSTNGTDAQDVSTANVIYPIFKKLKILQYTCSSERSISPMKQRATRRREKSASSAVQRGSTLPSCDLSLQKRSSCPQTKKKQCDFKKKVGLSRTTGRPDMAESEKICHFSIRINFTSQF
jgi:hypothetical protein